MTTRPYHAVVVGAGPGGLVSAAGLAGLGARVALIERRPAMGGDCLNFGCVPSKALLASARLAAAMRRAGHLGLRPAEGAVDLGAVLARVRAARAALAHHDSVERFRGLGVDVRVGAPGVLRSPREVEAGGEVLRTRHVVIASGARPAVPPIPGLAETPHHTNESLFDRLDPATRSIIILGGGPIGCEMAQALARLGVRVTLVQSAAQVLEREDADAAEIIAQALCEDGVDLRLGRPAERVEARAGGGVRVAVGAETVEADTLLVALGRKANIEGLGLEAAGVETTPRGVRVDDRLRTTAPGVWAVGDVIGGPQFTHYADAQARTVVRNIVAPWWPARFAPSSVPWATFTDPEVARAGLNEKEAKERGIAHDVHRVDLGDLDRPVCDGAPRGFIKVVAAKGTGRVLGATAVGHGAGDWIHEYALAIHAGVDLGAISSMIHVYPTWGEAGRRPADAYMRSRLTPAVRRLLGLRWRLG